MSTTHKLNLPILTAAAPVAARTPAPTVPATVDKALGLTVYPLGFAEGASITSESKVIEFTNSKNGPTSSFSPNAVISLFDPSVNVSSIVLCRFVPRGTCADICTLTV